MGECTGATEIWNTYGEWAFTPFQLIPLWEEEVWSEICSQNETRICWFQEYCHTPMLLKLKKGDQGRNLKPLII